MISRWRWLLSLFTRKLWFRVTLMALIGVATAVAGILFGPYLPDDWTIRIGASSIDGILNVLASSLLAVTVFSLSTIVAAYSAATTNVTPRATKLLMEDNTSQNVLGTFIGAFLFSLVGIIALNTGLYGSQGRAILLLVTIGIIALISATILRWIDYLGRFGRLSETVDRVEKATWEAMKNRLARPHLGGQPLEELGIEHPHANLVYAPEVGYVQHIDIAQLQDIAKSAGGEMFVEALPGSFVDPAHPVAVFSVPCDDKVKAKAARAFTVGAERTFDQDPRFGLCVLAEIASRALSPAINDPGTAIDVIGRAVRLLAKWGEFEAADDRDKIEFPMIWVPAISDKDIFDDIFAPISRDGSGMVEIHLRLQKAFAALASSREKDFQQAAQHHSQIALQRAEMDLKLEAEKARVRDAAARVMKLTTIDST